MKDAMDLGQGTDHDFGARLRSARESAGLTLQDVSARLKMPARVIDALESGRTEVLGAPVFVRGQLRSYARLLDVPLPAGFGETPAASQAPEIVSYVHTPRYRRLAEQAGRRAVYIVLTVALVTPVWLWTRPHLSSSLAPAQSLDDVPFTRLAAPGADEPARAPSRAPLVASIASLPEAPAAAVAPMLSMRFNADSWIEVSGPAPERRLIEKGLVSAGQTRSYDASQVGRVVLGNAAAVDVSHGREAVDLGPFSRANVARFALSSDGSLAPVHD